MLEAFALLQQLTIALPPPSGYSHTLGLLPSNEADAPALFLELVLECRDDMLRGSRYILTLSDLTRSVGDLVRSIVHTTKKEELAAHAALTGAQEKTVAEQKDPTP